MKLIGNKNVVLMILLILFSELLDVRRFFAPKCISSYNKLSLNYFKSEFYFVVLILAFSMNPRLAVLISHTRITYVNIQITSYFVVIL